MKQRIWAAKFMDGTISVKADIAVSYPNLLDARREYELYMKKKQIAPQQIMKK